jgi:ornithine cyclodeaminase/alanine dehydrogenase-like protein (mu-crystallin family)
LRQCDIESIFGKLSAQQLPEFVKILEKTLVEYSCQDGALYQPERGVVTLPGGQTSLFMPATTADAISVKIIGICAAYDAPPTIDSSRKLEPGLKSVLTLCDAQGQATGILNAAGTTAFRTSLGSTLLFRLWKTVNNIVVFGAGKQALWHIRVAIMLRGQDIRNITIVNRSSTRTTAPQRFRDQTPHPHQDQSLRRKTWLRSCSGAALD